MDGLEIIILVKFILWLSVFSNCLIIQWQTPHTCTTESPYTSGAPYYTANKTFTFPIAFTQSVSVFNVVFAIETVAYQYIHALSLTEFTLGSNTRTSGTGGYLAIGY